MKITDEIRSAIFSLAHLTKSNHENFKKSLKKAWDFVKAQIAKVIKLKKQLRTQSVVSFSYTNAKGKIRAAKGTLRTDLVVTHIKGTGTKKKNPLQVRYWDLDRLAFRSFNLLRLI